MRGPRSGSPGRSRRARTGSRPFYRSIATCLTFGMSARDIMTAQYATASDPVVGRAPDARPLRQPRAQPRVGLVAGGDAAAARGRDRAGGQDPQDRPGRDDQHGRGSSNQGDVHEGLNFAAIHKLPFVFVVENNGYAISVPAAMQVSVPDVADRAAGYGIPGRRRRRRRTCSPVTRRRATRSRGPGPVTARP